MFKTLIAILFITMVVADDSLVYKKFVDFVHKYEKVYKSQEEFLYRYGVFKKSLEFIAVSIMDGQTSHGITQFSDLTPEEFRAQYLNLKVNTQWCHNEAINAGFLKYAKVADSLDWRAQGMVSPIKNQGQCGSCWAFSTTGFMESQMLIKKKGPMTFSEQQLVDCDTTFDNGCNGGLQQFALEYVRDKGIMSDQDYSYMAFRGYCLYDEQKVKSKVKDIKCHQNQEISAIKQYLNEVGPMAIALDATDFQYYYGGSILKCRHSQLDHAVLLVGYGSENGEDYWIVKNSWGKSWGEQGFVRVSQKAGQNCAIGVYVVSADLA